jgi:hypothetical protein
MSEAPGKRRESFLDPGTAHPENVTEVFESKTPAENVPLKTSEQSTPLFSADEARGFRSRWDAVQTEFVDEPRKSVQEADNLVESVIQRLSQVFTDERGKLETQWESGDNVSTEDLRLALQRYRSFFTRLLSV